MGSRSNSGVQSTIHIDPVQNKATTTVGSDPRRGELIVGGNSRDAGKRCHSRSLPQREGIHFKYVSSPEKGWGPEARYQPEETKRVCSHVYRALKMEGNPLVERSPRKGNWMAKVDLKDAYFMVPIHKQDRDFLKFQFKGKCYKFNLACAPWVFTKVLKPVAAGIEDDRLYRRHTDHSRNARAPKRPRHLPDLPVGELGIYYWLQEVCARANTINRLSGFHGGLNKTGASPASGQDQKYQGRGPKAEYGHLHCGQEAIPILGEIECSNKSGASGTSVLPQPPNCLGQSLGDGGSGLLSGRANHSQHQGGAAMVGEPPLTMEWEDSGNRNPR